MEMESSSSKRARASNQLVSCLVDGCKSDLGKCRDYHRRHKVCELHSKTARVSIGGREQRFCQQCSRFHSLGEFDQGKRSCRKRLEGHNRRRRKPQPDSQLPSDGRGRILQAFSGSPMVPASSVVGSTWGGCVKAEGSPAAAAAVYSQMEALRGRQFPLLHSASDRALSLLSSSSAPLHASDWSPHCQDVDALHADASCSATGPHQTLSFFWE